jgi:hypothetical protein
MLEASRPARCCCSRTVQLVDAGDQTSGRGPSTRSSHPRARASSAVPEGFDVTVTTTQAPEEARLSLLCASAISPSSAAFSCETETASGAQSDRS